MKISVILPCFNGADTIAVQLEALTRQRWHDWEVVVVNNGSTDRSMEIVASYRGRLPRLRIVEAHEPGTERLGVTHSYSVGFAAAEGDAFVLCESDDEVGDGWLEALGNALRRHEFVAAALDYDRLNTADIVPTGHAHQTADNGLPNGSGPLYLPFASGCALGMRRSVYTRLGDPDPRCSATWDKDYCYRAFMAGIALEFVPAAVVHYRLRTTLRGAYKQGKNWAVASIACGEKYSPVREPQELRKLGQRAATGLLRHLLKAGIVIPSGRTPANDWSWKLGWWGGLLQGELGRWMSVKGDALLNREAARTSAPPRLTAMQVQPFSLATSDEDEAEPEAKAS